MCNASPCYTAGRSGGWVQVYNPWLWLLGNYLGLHASVSPSETWGLVSTSQSCGKLPLLAQLEP